MNFAYTTFKKTGSKGRVQISSRKVSMRQKSELSLTEILTHFGENPEQYFGAVVPPIAQTSNFRFKSMTHLRKVLADESQNPIYTRGCNPTVHILRKKMAALEKAEDALVFSSGSSAIAAGVLSQIKSGDHIICVQKPYGWTSKLLGKTLPALGVETTFVDGSQVENFAQALRPNSKLIYLESPNSWTFEVQDLPALAQLAKKHQLTTIVDNSCATPLSQNPIAMGIDMVVHSASKYLSGHSDVVGGVLCSTHSRIKEIFYGPFMTLGGIISPHDAWLILRGLRTLELRYHRSCDNAEKVVAFLESHPQIEKVLYTHSPRFSQYELAKSQIQRGGGLFSVILKSNNLAVIEKFCESLTQFQMAVSWGGYESLHFPACAFHNRGGSSPGALPLNMIRFYVGIENPETLIADLAVNLTQCFS